jgi:hypothetical protein
LRPPAAAGCCCACAGIRRRSLSAHAPTLTPSIAVDSVIKRHFAHLQKLRDAEVISEFLTVNEEDKKERKRVSQQ